MIRIGKIVAAHGLQGGVVLSHIVGKSDWLKPEAVLFLEINKGSYIPFFTAAVRPSNDAEYILSLEDVGSMEAAKKLIGKQVYVEENILSAHSEDSALLWIGFNLVDKQKGGLGLLEDVVMTASQWLGKLSYQGREVLVPLIPELIIEVNIRNKFIRIDLPEGLLEVYL